MPDFIYVMKDLRKVVPPKREILKGIWLSFYDGAKIGVLGLNGAGKSSLLRIMAGLDSDFMGEAFLGKGYTVGYLEQEPKLDTKKDVLGNVREGVAAKAKVVDRWNEISARFAEPMSDEEMEKLLADQAKVHGISEEAVIRDIMLAPAALKRLLEPSEVAAYVRFLCSDEASGITGATQVIDAGWTAR